MGSNNEKGHELERAVHAIEAVGEPAKPEAKVILRKRNPFEK